MTNQNNLNYLLLSKNPYIPLTAKNLGTGQSVFLSQVGNTLNFGGIKAGDNISVSKVGNDVVISSSLAQQTLLSNSITFGSASRVIGQLPTIAGRSVYVSRILLVVDVPFTGNGVSQARITSGLTNIIMDVNENDILAVGNYETETKFEFTSNNAICSIAFLNNSLNPVAPTAGSGSVFIEYALR